MCSGNVSAEEEKTHVQRFIINFCVSLHEHHPCISAPHKGCPGVKRPVGSVGSIKKGVAKEAKPGRSARRTENPRPDGTSPAERRKKKQAGPPLSRRLVLFTENPVAMPTSCHITILSCFFLFPINVSSDLVCSPCPLVSSPLVISNTVVTQG